MASGPVVDSWRGREVHGAVIDNLMRVRLASRHCVARGGIMLRQNARQLSESEDGGGVAVPISEGVGIRRSDRTTVDVGIARRCRGSILAWSSGCRVARSRPDC
jgi:hypothetical protein